MAVKTQEDLLPFKQHAAALSQIKDGSTLPEPYCNNIFEAADARIVAFVGLLDGSLPAAATMQQLSEHAVKLEKQGDVFTASNTSGTKGDAHMSKELQQTQDESMTS